MGGRKRIAYPQYISLLGLVLILCIVAGYMYLLHIGAAQQLLMSIRNLGLFGIVAGILIQAIVNVLPVPGEFTSIALMEIYGPLWGGVYSWIGGVTGAVGGLYTTKWIAKPVFGKMAEPYLHRMDEFIANREAAGLLAIRFVPFVPYHLVNYAAGLLSVNLWAFVWTTGLGILPYTVAMSGIFAGLREGSSIWGAAGGTIFALIAGGGWLAKKIKNKSAAAPGGKRRESE
ncbi:hypothetical protein SD70_16275 [Gordoniibacillus kamchatkensis]|uniref:TVP38/TMEM64 family membrane protein n=1 Tax=Gordoniibacillus kamchatkensis TaxID=1590651 RepID=A0ABR5AGW4_9BACL|nr:VTT domain-containing protein [Paenibacillus sp. VKM B-2647]KIL40073.1 hypothetical protein SD70_16275 [Paenibacillus sp. VKM B-2647]